MSRIARFDGVRERLLDASATLFFYDNHPGCYERAFADRDSPCALDGRFSIVQFRNEWLLFARANVARGARFVQVTRSRDLVEWAPFQLLQLDGLQDVTTDKNINVYWWGVSNINDALLAVFPMVHAGRGCIALSCSVDGLHWSQPSALFACGTDVPPVHTDSHPAVGIVRRGACRPVCARSRTGSQEWSLRIFVRASAGTRWGSESPIDAAESRMHGHVGGYERQRALLHGSENSHCRPQAVATLDRAAAKLTKSPAGLAAEFLWSTPRPSNLRRRNPYDPKQRGLLGPCAFPSRELEARDGCASQLARIARRVMFHSYECNITAWSLSQYGSLSETTASLAGSSPSASRAGSRGAAAAAATARRAGRGRCLSLRRRPCRPRGRPRARGRPA